MEAALDTRCPICLENWDSAAHTLPCLHHFCFPCIRRWTSSKRECPLCKQGVHSIIHSVQADNDFEELVLTPAPAAPEAMPRALGPQAVQQTPRAPSGGLNADTWASVFAEQPAVLRPPRTGLRQELGRSLATQRRQGNVLVTSVVSAPRQLGLEEGILAEALDQHLDVFVSSLVTSAMQRRSREGHQLPGLRIPPAAGAQEANPVPQPAPTAPAEEAPGREPAQPVAGPSSSSTSAGTRRAPKRSSGSCQAQEPPKKRPPGRQP